MKHELCELCISYVLATCCRLCPSNIFQYSIFGSLYKYKHLLHCQLQSVELANLSNHNTLFPLGIQVGDIGLSLHT